MNFRFIGSKIVFLSTISFAITTVNNLVPETLYIFQIITRNDYGDALTKSVNCTTDHSMYDVVIHR
jgi:methionyl-tRNA formyltransferase